jgi:hypothetical protein
VIRESSINPISASCRKEQRTKSDALLKLPHAPLIFKDEKVTKDIEHLFRVKIIQRSRSGHVVRETRIGCPSSKMQVEIGASCVWGAGHYSVPAEGRQRIRMANQILGSPTGEVRLGVLELRGMGE